MIENKADRYLQFMDGVVINQQLWCVDKNTLLLLKIEIDSWNVVESVDIEKYVDSKNAPRKIFHRNKKIYITFLYGNKILSVDIETLVVTEICFGCDCEIPRMNAVLYNECIYMFPRIMKGEVYIYDLLHKKGSQISLPDCSEDICIINNCLVDNYLYGITIGKSHLLCVDLDNLKWFIKDLGSYKLLDIGFANGELWILESKNLLKCTLSLEVSEEIYIPKDLGTFSRVISIEDELLLMPYIKNVICSYKLKEKRFFKLLVTGISNLRTESGTLCFGYSFVDKKVLLFPWSCNAILEYNSRDLIIGPHRVCVEEIYAEKGIAQKEKSPLLIRENILHNLYVYISEFEMERKMGIEDKKKTSVGESLYHVIKML